VRQTLVTPDFAAPKRGEWPQRHAGVSIRSQQAFSEVRRAGMSPLEEVPGDTRPVLREQKGGGRRGNQGCPFQEGSPAGSIHELYRSLQGYLFTDVKTKDCLSIRSRRFPLTIIFLNCSHLQRSPDTLLARRAGKPLSWT
jgi:hypothetical protein